jgi:hypothetical protein
MDLAEGLALFGRIVFLRLATQKDLDQTGMIPFQAFYRRREEDTVQEYAVRFGKTRKREGAR